MASDFSIDFRDKEAEDYSPPSQDWISNYHPSKLKLLNLLNNRINNIDTRTQYIINTEIPRLTEIYQNLNNLNDIISDNTINEINATITEIDLRKAICAFFDSNNNPIFDQDHYPEFIEDGNDNFSNASICFILDQT